MNKMNLDIIWSLYKRGNQEFIDELDEQFMLEERVIWLFEDFDDNYGIGCSGVCTDCIKWDDEVVEGYVPNENHSFLSNIGFDECDAPF